MKIKSKNSLKNSLKNYSNKLLSNKLLSNKYVLYSTLVLSLLFLLRLLLANKIALIGIFALIAYIIYCFNRNMIVVLGIALIITYIATLGMKVKEGMTNSDSTTAIATKKEKPTATDSTAATATDSTATDAAATAATAAATATDSTANPKTSSTNFSEGSKPAVKTSSTTVKDGMDIMSNKKNNRIDYASTVEDAYDDLNKILGSDGMQRLTNDTHKLMEQQVKLADAMKNMTPLIDSAKSLMSGFDFNSLNSLSGMAKQFMPSK